MHATTTEQFAITVLTSIAIGILGGSIAPKASASRTTALHTPRQASYGAKVDERSKQSTLQFRSKKGA